MKVKIPNEVTRRCLRPGCDGTMTPLQRTLFVGNDEAMVTTACTNQCGMTSVETWGGDDPWNP